jgi:hypothetical protein
LISNCPRSTVTAIERFHLFVFHGDGTTWHHEERLEEVIPNPTRKEIAVSVACFLMSLVFIVWYYTLHVRPYLNKR